MLETKRRRAHSDETAARIAAHLGFSSATNFSKYFQSRAGQSPIQFRNTATAAEPASGARLAGQEREGVVDALLEDLVGELPVGQ
jgi:AraC-like DNA-binding protein